MKLHTSTALFVILLAIAIIANFSLNKAFAAPSCPNTANAEVVFMLDKSGSMEGGDLAKMADGVKAFLKFFQTSANPPAVAIGTYNCPKNSDDYPSCTKNQAARIVENGQLTQNYGNPNNPATGLYAVLKDLKSQDPNGRTDMRAAISEAQAHLDLNGKKNKAHFIVALGDGGVNLPFKTEEAPDCPTAFARGKADQQTVLAEEKGTKIFAVYVVPHDFNKSCTKDVPKDKAFLETQIASNVGFYFDKINDLDGDLIRIAQAIACDDSNMCTIDSCNESNGQCIVTPLVPEDSDQDGIDNCFDQCPGFSDDLLGTSCAEGFGACSDSGEIMCGGDELVCSSEPGLPKTETCNGIDDDCDGLIDEDFGVGNVCLIGVGQCQSTGVMVCSIDGGTACSATLGQPTIETCDFIDNDCDGLIDEQDVCACKSEDLSALIVTMDSNSLAIFNRAKKLTKLATLQAAAGKGKYSIVKTKKVASSYLAHMSDLHMSIWIGANSLPIKAQSCPSAIACVQINSVSKLSDIETDTQSMKVGSIKFVKKVGLTNNKPAKRLLKKINSLFKKTQVTTSDFPVTVSACD